MTDAIFMQNMIKTHQLLFKTKFDQNNTSKRTRLHQSFQNFLREHASEPPSISVADIIISI